MSMKRTATITVSPELIEAGNRAVSAGLAPSLSGWVSAALEQKADLDDKLRNMAAAIADYEAEFGVITDEEIAQQEREDRARAVVVEVALQLLWKAVTLILDTGALIALERNDRAMWKRFTKSQRRGDPPKTHGGVIGQVWRDGAKQARLAVALSGMIVEPLDRRLGSRAGELLRRAGGTGVIDATLAALAMDGDEILTQTRPTWRRCRRSPANTLKSLASR